MYLVYILRSGNYTYVGMTNNFFRRFCQHNQILKGGAKYTSKRKNWYPFCIIDGFQTKKEALQCEWAIKHHRVSRNKNSCKRRIENLNALIQRGYWTNQSKFNACSSVIYYIDDEFKEYLHPTVQKRQLYWRCE
jgi:predicted GIY-YIG superfamily endonuclease